MTATRFIIAIVLAATLGGCAQQIDMAKVKQHQLEVQKMQTLVFDTNNKNAIIRGVIAALQELDFLISNADTEHGMITAKKFGTYPIDMTVTIQTVSSTRILVHAIAQNNLNTLEEPALYDRFFTTLKSYIPENLRATQ